MKASFENVRVMLHPLENQFTNRPPDLQVRRMGAFLRPENTLGDHADRRPHQGRVRF